MQEIYLVQSWYRPLFCCFVNNLPKLRNSEVGNYFMVEKVSQKFCYHDRLIKSGDILDFQKGGGMNPLNNYAVCHCETNEYCLQRCKSKYIVLKASKGLLKKTKAALKLHQPSESNLIGITDHLMELYDDICPT